MEMIFYPGFSGQPCRAEYGIAHHRESTTRADIVAINSRRLGLATSLINTEEGRDMVLNKILAHELEGVRIDFVRFFVLVDTDDPEWMPGFEFPICVDGRVDSRTRHGRWFQRLSMDSAKVPQLGRNFAGAHDKFRTDFEGRRSLSFEEIQTLCTAINYERKRIGLPSWITAAGA